MLSFCLYHIIFYILHLFLALFKVKNQIKCLPTWPWYNNSLLIVLLVQSIYKQILVINIAFCLNWHFDLEDDPESQKQYHKCIVQSKTLEREVLYKFQYKLYLFKILFLFIYLEIELLILKLIFNHDFLVQITWKRALNLFLPLFVEKSYLILTFTFTLRVHPLGANCSRMIGCFVHN